jgi:alpha-mannosidase
MVRLSLLSAQQFPDPRADVGGHDFAWSVVVDADEAQSVEAACKVNAPVFDDVPDFEPLVGFEEVTGVPVIDWMKLADDGSDDLIVRIYEAAGGKASAVLRTGDEMKDATVRETDVLERSVVFSDEPYALKGAREGWATVARGAHIELGPFQLATLRLHVPVNNEEVNKEVNK